MTAEIVNLRRARKARARTDRQQQAAENRVRFGRTKEERRADEAAAIRDARAHAGNELQRDGGSPSGETRSDAIDDGPPSRD